jgi:hypothetical protein
VVNFLSGLLSAHLRISRLSSSGSSTSRADDDNEKLVVGEIDDTPKTLLVAKDAMSIAVKDRRITIAGSSCEAKAVGEKEEHIIFCTKAKAARAVFKVDAPCHKMGEVINGTIVLISLGRVTAPEVPISHRFHPHKQLKGILGLSSPVQPLAVCSQPYPQQWLATANRRVSVQSFLRLFLHSPEYLSSSVSFTSVSGDNNEILVGEVTDKEIKTPFGDWNSYLVLAQGVDSQSQGNSLSSIQVEDWRSIQSNSGDSSVPLSSVAAVGAPGGRSADGLKDSGGSSLGHNLCNKTHVDPIESLPFIGLGTVVTAIPHCALSRTVSSVKASYGHLDIRIRFSAICVCTPAKFAAAQQIESGIAMHKIEDATQVKVLRALQLIFSMAAQIKFGPKEKRPSKQIFPTSRQPDVCASASTDPLVERPVQ